nr:hypothetical protein [Polyangium aurulentum]
MIDDGKLDGARRITAPARERGLEARTMLIEALGLHGLRERDDGATALALREPLEIIAVIPIKPNAMPLSLAPGIDVDRIRIDGEHRNEPDAIFTDLGGIALLGRIEQGEKGPLDGGPIHTAPIIPERGGRDAPRPLDPDRNRRSPSIDAVLHELTDERIRIRKLPHHIRHRPRLRLLDNRTLALRTIGHTAPRVT